MFIRLEFPVQIQGENRAAGVVILYFPVSVQVVLHHDCYLETGQHLVRNIHEGTVLGAIRVEAEPGNGVVGGVRIRFQPKCVADGEEQVSVIKIVDGDGYSLGGEILI